VESFRNNIQYSFEKLICLSSVDIENQYLEKINLTSNDKHLVVRQHNLNLLKFINLPENVRELIDFLIFQIGEYN
jgi:hypothetical protein